MFNFNKLKNRLNPYHREPFGSKMTRFLNPKFVTKYHKPLPFSHSTGADQSDYCILDWYIGKHKPKTILELGGGVTTWVMAKAIEQYKLKTLLYSIEHISEWHYRTLNLFGDPDLHNTILLRSIRGDMYNGQSVLRYDDLPQHHYDMIFCDFTDAIGNHYFPHIDPLLLLTDEPTDIITDRKLYTLKHYAKWLSCPVYYDPVYSVGFIKGATKKDLKVSGNRLKIGDIFSL